MADLLQVIVPVFLVIGAGYTATARGLFSDEAVEGLMAFTQTFAIPCLLFRAIATLDLSATFDAPLLISFYAGAVAGFVAGLLGARYFFSRSWPDAVAIGFCGLFSNSVLLGLPIAERAYGTASLDANYAIVAIHAPFCYVVGVVAMEIARGTGGVAAALPRVIEAMFHNALVIGIGLGFAVNLSGLVLPGIVADALDLMVRAALPAALFGLGGILVRYRVEGDLRTMGWICAASLILHPTVTWGIGRAFGLAPDALRAAVLTAAMAPGVNTYIFASIYGVARRVAASGVLIGTALSIVTVWAWLAILP